MIKVKVYGDYKKVSKYLTRIRKVENLMAILNKYGEIGVQALSEATPVRTGETASSWTYAIVKSKSGGYSLVWKNTNRDSWANVSLLIQYGHYTRGHGYVQGIDYINPALKPVFEKIADSAWKEVTSV